MERPVDSHQKHLSISHKVCGAYNPNLTYLLDNVNSDEDECSDVDDDCIPIDDTLLDVSAIPANTTSHNSRKRTREEIVLSPARLEPHSVRGIRQRNSPPRVPAAPASSSNVSDLTLTCQDGTVFQMAEFMKLMMEQLKTTNKVLSKGEESESSKRLRLAEAEVIKCFSDLFTKTSYYRMKRKHPSLLPEMSVTMLTTSCPGS